MNPFNFRPILTGKMLVICATILVALVVVASSHKEPEPQEAERAVVCPPGRAMPNPSTVTMPDGTVIDVNSMWHTEALEEWPK